MQRALLLIVKPFVVKGRVSTTKKSCLVVAAIGLFPLGILLSLKDFYKIKAKAHNESQY